MTQPGTIPAAALRRIDPRRGAIIDVRTAAEHAGKRIGIDHIHIPLDELDPVSFMTGHGLGPDADICILCHSGRRAAVAAEKFAAAGYSNVKIIEGGIVACEECGQPVKTGSGKTVLPLDRQVRIAAGLTAAAGAALALSVDPLFALIPLCAGCGLIYAGITDRCGLAMILAKAPWNKT